MSARTDRLLVWRSMRCVAQGLNACSNAGVENVSTSFHAPREPQRSTRFGPPHNKSFSQSKDGTFLMRLPSGMRAAWALTATPLKLARSRTYTGQNPLCYGSGFRIGVVSKLCCRRGQYFSDPAEAGIARDSLMPDHFDCDGDWFVRQF
jgi:hypothetical protein